MVTRKLHKSCGEFLFELLRLGGALLVSLDQWRQRLIDRAANLKQQSEQQLAANNFREAERLSRQMVNMWPDLQGGEELRLEIARKYPMIIVGVAETAVKQDVTSIDNWPGRRTGPERGVGIYRSPISR